VISETVGEGHIVEEHTGKKRLIGINAMESVIKEERITEGETRVVGEKRLEGRRRSQVKRSGSTTRQEVEVIKKEKIIEVIK